MSSHATAGAPPRRRAIARRLLPGALAVVLVACNGGDSSEPAKPDLLGEPPIACAGADLSGLRTTVFVSTAGADSGTCGASTGAACKSVQQGIANCSGAACGVLVGPGTYDLASAAAGLPRNVVLREGVSVIGGCVFDGSADPRYRSMLRGPAGVPAVSASGIAGSTLLHGFVVVAGSSTASDGTASIAMSVDASPALVLRHLRLVGGPGARGADGQRGGTTYACDSTEASCSSAGGIATGPQAGRYVKATWAGGAGGAGGVGRGITAQLGPGCITGGTGGEHGGASIGLLLNDSQLALDPSVVSFASRGGDGGNGGAGGTEFDLNGSGAGAAGGNGGSSFGLVANGSSPLPVVNEGVFGGTPGAPGGLGQGAFGILQQCRSADGAPGLVGTSAAAYRVGANWLAQNQGPFKGIAPYQLAYAQEVDSPSGLYKLLMLSTGQVAFIHFGASQLWISDGRGDNGQAAWLGDQFCTGAAGAPWWCAGTTLPGPVRSFGSDAFLAVEDGRIAIYNAAGTTLWSAP